MIEKGAVCMGTETTQIIDLNAEKGKEVQEGEKGWNLLAMKRGNLLVMRQKIRLRRLKNR